MIGRAGKQAIATSAADSEQVALAELQRALRGRAAPGEPERRKQHGARGAGGAFRIELLAPGIMLFPLPGSFATFSARLRQNPPLFIRHIQPAQVETALAGIAGDLEQLVAAATELTLLIEPGRSFSVQTRLTATLIPHPAAPPPPYGRYEVNERLAAVVTTVTGAPLDVRSPEQVLSVLVTPEVGYLGVSKTEENLSSWAGGAIRFAREAEQVSRAEFKLLEALAVFPVSLPDAGAALDLGAAPGGWTRLLRRAGLEVTAVDPAELDPRVAADPGVRHVRSAAQEYRCREGAFAVIVNDMRMDARDSARLMLDLSRCLTPEGLAIMTLKLPEHAPEPVARRALDLLQQRYQLLGARQLYHNRSEITAALQRRDEG